MALGVTTAAGQRSDWHRSSVLSGLLLRRGSAVVLAAKSPFGLFVF